MPRRRGSRGHPNTGLHARQRRVSASAALALKREFEPLLDAGKLFRFCGRDLNGRTFTVYSIQMDAQFMNTQLESLVCGSGFVGAVMRIWHKNFTAEELTALRHVIDWVKDAFEGDDEPDNMPDVVGARLNNLCRRANAVIEVRGYALQGNECARLSADVNKQCQCICSATGVWMGEEPGVTYA